MASHDQLIASFVDITGGDESLAQEYLEEHNWNLQEATAAYYAEDEPAPLSATAPENPPAAEYTGPRTLDGRPAPQYADMSSASSKKPQKRTGLATLSSLGGSSHGHGHAHDDDDDDDDEDYSDDEKRGPRDLFAGGEKSGLAVQDPSQRSSDPLKLINDIVAKAKANAKSKEGESSSSSTAGPSRFFSGGGNILGGDGVESRRIGDPESSAAAPAAASDAVQERVLHIWEDGFSIDDGELRRFDDPQNQADLALIRQGRAPLHLMNVRYDQRVDVKLQQHQEKFKQLPKIYRPFSGEGRRLGSPVPGVPSVAPAPAATSTTQGSAGASQNPTTGFDASQPALALRIQLPNGTRLPARFNTTQTVGDVYEFVQRALTDAGNRSWVLSTTFPNKDHTDKSLVLGEMNEFKRGGTAVVKWA